MGVITSVVKSVAVGQSARGSPSSPMSRNTIYSLVLGRERQSGKRERRQRAAAYW